MRELTQVEYDVLNELYFVETFDKILEEVNSPSNIVKDSLRFLIEHKFVTAMRWDESQNEYVRSNIYDGDNMHAYAYVATRKGLLEHYARING